MNPLEIVAKLANRKGQNVPFTYERAAKVRAKNPPPFAITKRTTGIFRAGIDHENRAAIMEKRAEGVESAGLSGRTWEFFPFILKSEKTEKSMLRLYPTSGTARPSVEWFADGSPVALEAVAPYLLASELPKPADERQPQGEFCFDIPCENVLAIG